MHSLSCGRTRQGTQGKLPGTVSGETRDETRERALQPVLLSGGSGTRLWPLSREAYPKQFLPLAGDAPMLQATWLRVARWLDAARRIVVPARTHRFLVAEQLRQIGVPPAAIVLEPVGRNTAPAIAVAALQARESRRRSAAAGAALRPRDRAMPKAFRAAVQRRACRPPTRGATGHLRHRARTRRRPAMATSTRR